jgi:hypothetical protein
MTVAEVTKGSVVKYTKLLSVLRVRQFDRRRAVGMWASDYRLVLSAKNILRTALPSICTLPPDTRIVRSNGRPDIGRRYRQCDQLQPADHRRSQNPA